MRAGPLRNRFMLWEEKLNRNPTGGFDREWVELASLWGELATPSGRTQAVAEQLNAVVTAEIRARPRSSIIAGRRLSHAGVTYLVEAVLPDNKRLMFRILCSSVANA